MDLAEYRWKKGVTYAEVARRVGCTKDHINRIALRRIKPGIHLATFIELATEGIVTVEDLLRSYEEGQKEEEKEQEVNNLK